MICKSNNNSYHDGTSAFFNIFFEKDPHPNAVENNKSFWSEIKNIFPCFASTLFTHTKQTSKNVADTTFKHKILGIFLWGKFKEKSRIIALRSQQCHTKYQTKLFSLMQVTFLRIYFIFIHTISVQLCRRLKFPVWFASDRRQQDFLKISYDGSFWWYYIVSSLQWWNANLKDLFESSPNIKWNSFIASSVHWSKK